MASLVTHPIIPLAIAVVLGRKIVPPSILLLGVLLSILPDADSLAFRFGIPYSSAYGHRGFTHSIVFAFLIAALVWLLSRKFGGKTLPVFIFLFVSMLSHGMLDAFTDQGNGVAFFWPFTDHRYFFSLHPVEASPISVSRFLTHRGLEILTSEAKWIWMPTIALSVVGFCIRKQLGANTTLQKTRSEQRDSER